MVALGVALIGLIVLNFLRSRGPESRDVDAVLPASSASEGARTDAADPPRNEVRASPSIQPADRVPRGDTPTDSAASPLLPNQAPPTPMADVLARRGMPVIPELIETERRFALEPVDPAWSTAAEARILTKIAEVPGLELVSLDVECRQTLCRLQFVTPGPHPTGPPPPRAPDPAAPQVPGIAEIARATGLTGRWVFGFTELSMAYLERGEDANSPVAAPQ
jgi:hypothetical protein